MIDVITKNCPADHRCPMTIRCPKKAITQDGFSAPEINQEACTECMLCVRMCPYDVFSKN